MSAWAGLRARVAGHGWWLGAALSWFLCAPLPWLARSRFGDLSDRFTDHLHHAYATWMFLERGLEVYTRPLAELWLFVPYAQSFHSWGHMPMAYPPGVFVVFLPLALLGRFVSLSQATFGAIGVSYLLVIAHVALAAVWRAVAEAAPGGRLIVAALVWLVLVRLGLQGFFDPLWLGCGAMMVLALRRGQPGRALVWFAAAELVHFRAVMLAPLGLYALVLAVRGRPVRQWPHASLLAAGVGAALAVATFALMYPVTATQRLEALPVSHYLGSLLLWSVVAVGVAAVSFAVAERDHVLAVTLGLGTLLAVIDFNGYLGFWHHASLALVAALVVGTQAGARSVARTRQVAVMWLLALEAMVWGNSPFELLGLLGKLWLT